MSTIFKPSTHIRPNDIWTKSMHITNNIFKIIKKNLKQRIKICILIVATVNAQLMNIN